MEDSTDLETKKRKLETEVANEEPSSFDLDKELMWLNDLSVSELKNLADERKLDVRDVVEKTDLLQKVKSKLILDFNEGIPFKRKKTAARRDCPYLDTIERPLLDFDFEKLCSVTLQNLNVYACLVCGKYFQGRSKQSPAYVHSLQQDHHVFINLHNEKIFCLPDDYEVIESSLGDIKYYLNPTFTPEAIKKLDSNNKTSTALDGTSYLPGYIGLNSIKNTDYINAVLQSLTHVATLRNFFLSENNYSQHKENALVARFGDLTRKMYNPKNFKSHVSPHELLQVRISGNGHLPKKAISTASAKKFGIGIKADPLDFTMFFLNSLHSGLGGGKRPGSSIIHKVFQGHLEVWTEIKKRKEEMMYEDDFDWAKEIVPFLFLGLDIPPPPLFKDEQEKNIIPQIPIFNLLAKYDGKTVTHQITGGISRRKKFLIRKLPQYLIVHMKRFAKNQFFMEKNPTIVNFPLKSLDLRDYMEYDPNIETKYDLVANICHEGDSTKGNWRAHVLHKGGSQEQWYEIQDLVVRPILPQLINLTEAYIQIYERQSNNKN